MKIPIKKFTFNPNASWEDNYKALEKHHEEETKYLIDLLKKPSGSLERLDGALSYLENAMENYLEKEETAPTENTCDSSKPRC